MPSILSILSDSYSEAPTYKYNAFRVSPAVTFPCQTERHRGSGIRADFVAFLYEHHDTPDPVDSIVVIQAWYECAGCRKEKIELWDNPVDTPAEPT